MHLELNDFDLPHSTHGKSLYSRSLAPGEGKWILGNRKKGKGMVYCSFLAFGQITLAVREMQEGPLRVYKSLFAAEMSNCVL